MDTLCLELVKVGINDRSRAMSYRSESITRQETGRVRSSCRTGRVATGPCPASQAAPQTIDLLESAGKTMPEEPIVACGAPARRAPSRSHARSVDDTVSLGVAPRSGLRAAPPPCPRG